MIDSDIVTVTVGVTDPGPVTVAARRDRRRGCAAASEAATVTRPLRQPECPGRGPGLAAASPRLAPGPRPPGGGPGIAVGGAYCHGDRASHESR